MNLIIVESPTKAKTIAKFVGAEYKVESSFGHIRDLPEREMGIDIEHNFTPKYVIPDKSKKTVANLKKLADKAEKIILASDEDREGEAIAWHLTQALNTDEEKIDRIVFHEITKDAIREALKSPRRINADLVDAQQARRILDRLVGYELSPFLWKKVAKGLSAGRVQSVAVRLIVEREREIQNFKQEEYWTIEAEFKSPSPYKGDGGGEVQGGGSFLSKLNKINGKVVGKLQIKNKEQADKILSDLRGASYMVANIEKRQGKRNVPAPFTTSTLQQTANRWLGFSARQTMTIAQKLYETGYITYMRTDSLNLSDKFLSDAENYLKNSFGKNYSSPKRFKTKAKGAQEAHEAIRPTEASADPEKIKDKLDDAGQYRLYKLIWQRAVASQMPEAIFDNTTVDINAVGTGHCPVPTGKYQFRSNGQVLKFDGYLRVYPEKSQEIELPELKEKEKLNLIKLEGLQHFTKPPARYSDAGLVKELEQYGIGRPSTYAPTIATIIERNYVKRDESKRLAPNDIALVVNDLLVAHFPQIVDYQFTAAIEKKLDNIAMGETKWQPVIKNFYEPFHENLITKYSEVQKKDVLPEEKSEEVCDKCGAPMIIKTGRYGKFLACSAFPKCKNIKSLNNGQNGNGPGDPKIKELEKKYKGEVCEKCGAPMIVKNGRFGPFLSCSAYPKCKNIKNIRENNNSTGIKCPSCGKGEIVQKRGRRGIFYACSNYPECKNAYWAKPTGEKCPHCQSLLIMGKNDTAKCSNKECGYST